MLLLNLMNQKLKIGLLLEDDYINKYQKELVDWITNQSEMEVTHYLIASNTPSIQTSKIKKLLSISFIRKYLNNYLKKLGLIEVRHELLLVRNTFIKRELKSANKLNKSIESIIEKINPQGNPYPSPYP